EAGAHAVDRVGADHVGGRAEVDQRESCSLGEERLDGDADADGDGAAEILAGGGGDVGGDGGSEGDDDAGAGGVVEAGNPVDEAVGSHFERIVVLDGDAEIGLRADEQRHGVEVAFGCEGEGGVDGRYDAGNDHAVHVGDVQADGREEIAEQDAPLVG